MNVIFCTPYKSTQKWVQGGIGVWARNIMSYNSSLDNPIPLIPISFDRSSIGRKCSRYKILKMWYDFSEIGRSTLHVYIALIKKKNSLVHLCTSAGTSLLKDIAVLKVARFLGVRSVVHFHFGRIPELFLIKNKEYRRLLKVIELASCCVTMDLRSYETLKNYGYTHVKYLPNPLSLDFIETIDKRLTMSRIQGQILFVGHIYKTKGVCELVQACSRLDNCCLRFVGKYTDEIKQELLQIGSSRKGNWITFTGELEHKQVIDEFLSSDIFVFPSYTEGFPNVILEAMACRIPIISSSVGAIPEMLSGKDICGILIKPKDVDCVYHAISSLLNNEEKKKEMSENAYKRVINTYSMPIVWEQLLNIWSEK